MLIHFSPPRPGPSETAGPLSRRAAFLYLSLLCLSSLLPSGSAIREPVLQDIRNRMRLSNMTAAQGQVAPSASAVPQSKCMPLQQPGSFGLSLSSASPTSTSSPSSSLEVFSFAASLERQRAMHWRRKVLATTAAQAKEQGVAAAPGSPLGRPLCVTTLTLLIWAAVAVSRSVGGSASGSNECGGGGSLLSACLLLGATLATGQLLDGLLSHNFVEPFLLTCLASVGQSACYLVHLIKERTRQSDSWIIKPRVPMAQICLVGLLGVVACLLTAASLGLLGLDSLLLVMLLKLLLSSALGHRLVANIDEVQRARLVGLSLVCMALACWCWSCWSWSEALGQLSSSSSSAGSSSSSSSSSSPASASASAALAASDDALLLRLSAVSLALGGAATSALHMVYQRKTMDEHSVPSTLMVGLEGLLGFPLSASCLALANFFGLESSLGAANCLQTSGPVLGRTVGVLTAFVVWHWAGCSLGKSATPASRALVDALALVLCVALGNRWDLAPVAALSNTRPPPWLSLPSLSPCLVFVGAFLYFFGAPLGLGSDNSSDERDEEKKEQKGGSKFKGDLLPGL